MRPVEATPLRALFVTVLLLASAAFVAPPAAAALHQVAAIDFAWTPDELTIAPGDSVEFVLGSGTHNWVPDFEADACALPCTVTFPDEGAFPYHCGFHPTMTGVVFVGTPPTIAISTPAAGATVSGVVEITGTATHATSAVASVEVTIGGVPASEGSIETIPGGLAWSMSVPTTSLANGAQTIYVSATTANGLVGNATRGIVVENPVSIDMAILSAAAQQSATTSNTISIIVRNQGNTPSAVTLLAEYEHQGAWHAIGTTSVNVGVGANAPATLVWTPSSLHVGAFQVRVTADPDATLPDPDRANNARTTTAGWFTTAVPGVVVAPPA